MSQTYQQDIKFLESLANIPKQEFLLGLYDRSIFITRLKNFLKLLGNPEKKIKIIHIAGTSGKGTTVRILQDLMSNANLKVGSYTSPFATTTIEKVQIKNKLISPQQLHKILEKKVNPALDKYLVQFPTQPLSYFETFLALALIHFKEQKCQWVILETGCGGTHDATNVIPHPLVTAITNIGLDHTHLLGNTKIKIAKDKAGIIKPASKFLTTEKNKKLIKIFKKVCAKKKAKYINLENLVKEYNTDNYFSTKRQKENLKLALNILKELKIKPKNIQSVINKFSLPCRQEIIQTNPLVILDGAHNSDKLNNLIEFIKQQKYKKLYLILGFAHTKNYNSSLKKLLAISNKIYLTRFLVTFRKSAELRELYKRSKKIKPNLAMAVHNDPWQALQSALKLAKKDDLVLITGSFFLTGELRNKWIPEDYIIKHLKLDKK